MKIFALSLHFARELFVLALITNPVALSKTFGEIAKNLGIETADWSGFAEICYFFGDSDAAFELCELNAAKENYDLYYTYRLEAARMGNIKAQQIVFYVNRPKGNMLADSMALELLKRENAEVMVYLGERMLLNKEYNIAYTLLMQALWKGKSKACGHLGFICHKGLIQNKNDEMAMFYWKKGIEYHDPLSEYLFATTQLAKHKRKNLSGYREAIYYLVCAASHGFYMGQLELAKIIKNDIENAKTNDLLTISQALKCHSTKSSGHFDRLFHLKNDFEEACF